MCRRGLPIKSWKRYPTMRTANARSVMCSLPAFTRWKVWGDQVSHVHVADNDVVRLSMKEYEPTDYPGVSLVRLYDNTEK